MASPISPTATWRKRRFVAVDTETGEVRIERFISADDVGKAINPQQVTGQIEGGVVQALGYTPARGLQDQRRAAC